MKWQYNTVYNGKKLSFTLSFDRRSCEARYDKVNYRFNGLNPLTFTDDIISLLEFSLKKREK